MTFFTRYNRYDHLTGETKSIAFDDGSLSSIDAFRIINLWNRASGLWSSGRFLYWLEVNS